MPFKLAYLWLEPGVIALPVHGFVTVLQLVHPVYVDANAGLILKVTIEPAIKAMTMSAFFTDLKLSGIQ
jgi:hypothetical protein